MTNLAEPFRALTARSHLTVTWNHLRSEPQARDAANVGLDRGWSFAFAGVDVLSSPGLQEPAGRLAVVQLQVGHTGPR
jgi:hypothetical protein